MTTIDTITASTEHRPAPDVVHPYPAEYRTLRPGFIAYRLTKPGTDIRTAEDE